MRLFAASSKLRPAYYSHRLSIPERDFRRIFATDDAYDASWALIRPRAGVRRMREKLERAKGLRASVGGEADMHLLLELKAKLLLGAAPSPLE
jgi:hypothetical protein